MWEFFAQYGLFLAKVVTLVGAVGAIIAIIALSVRRDGGDERLEVKNLNERYQAMTLAMKQELLPKKQFKSEQKAKQKRDKEKAKSVSGETERLYVLNFKGDIRASGVKALREEVSAVLTMASNRDEVLVKLENAGGVVQDHGLAASQLMRIRTRDIPLTVAVDKIAASGGYMMACVANRILAAPFAVLGSIGVLAQLPNFNRWLDARGVDFEQFKGGEFKRTVTVFGKNTAEDRAKFAEEINETHTLFKDFVAEQRPALDIGAVATGEHWYGCQALALKLCDEITTSDDYLMKAAVDRDVVEVKYVAKQPLGRRLAAGVQALADRFLGWA